MTIYGPGFTPTAQEGTVTTGTTNPAPAYGSDWFSSSTNDVSAYQRLTVSSTGAWRFRRLLQVTTVNGTAGTNGPDVDFFATRTGGDVTNALQVRVNPAGFLRVVGSGTTAFTSTTTFPFGQWVLVQAYGNGVDNLARVALCSLAGVPLTGQDTGLITVQQGGIAPTGIREGKNSVSTGYTGRVLWGKGIGGTEFHTSGDAPQSFIGPYSSANAAPSGTITTAGTIGQNRQVDLRGTATDANGTITSTVWSIPAWPSSMTGPPTITNAGSLTSAYFTAVAPGNYTMRLTITDDAGAVTAVDKALVVSEIGRGFRGVWNGTTYLVERA